MSETFTPKLCPFRASIDGLPVGVTLAERLRHFKDVFRFSWEELARETGVNAKTLQRWTSGEDPSPRNLDALGIGVTKLLLGGRGFTAPEAQAIAMWLTHNKTPIQTAVTSDLPTEYRLGARLVLLCISETKLTTRTHREAITIGKDGISQSHTSEDGPVTQAHSGKLYNISRQHWDWLKTSFPSLEANFVELERPTMIDVERSYDWDYQ
jgi:transcriptional regulator with XRE-family HTH domain